VGREGGPFECGRNRLESRKQKMGRLKRKNCVPFKKRRNLDESMAGKNDGHPAKGRLRGMGEQTQKNRKPC